MSVLPIIFSAPMVRALLDGRKTQTRRIIKPRPFNRQGDVVDIGFAQRASYVRGADGRMYFSWDHPKGGPLTAYVANYATGDRMWVREAFTMGFDCDDNEIPIGDVPKPFYAATYDGARWYDSDRDEWRDEPRWTPSIHMPRWASRITLTVTDVRVQRLQEISEEDARAEGWPGPETDLGYPIIGPRKWFAGLWDSLNGPGAWDANSWVVAITFTVAQRNIDVVTQ